jgi:hypothetical protein
MTGLLQPLSFKIPTFQEMAANVEVSGSSFNESAYGLAWPKTGNHYLQALMTPGNNDNALKTGSIKFNAGGMWALVS